MDYDCKKKYKNSFQTRMGSDEKNEHKHYYCDDKPNDKNEHKHHYCDDKRNDKYVYYECVKKCQKYQDIHNIVLIGVGAAGGHLLNRLSLKYDVQAFEAGFDRRDDGFTYNLAAAAPAIHNKVDIVAPFNPTFPPSSIPPQHIPPPGFGNLQWAGVTFQLPYTVQTPTEPAFPPLIGSINWTAGIMLGGSHEHIQGLYVNPSQSQCDRWAAILKDDRYRFENLFPRLQKTERFRYHTDYTTQTYDGTDYGPLDGPSIDGSKPIRRGYNGVLAVTQASPSNFSLNLSKIIYDKFHNDLGYDIFRQEPIVEQECSETYNSGVNICVTQSPERFLDEHRIRSSVVRAYLNDSVMTNLDPDMIPPNTSAQYTINNGIYKGINKHTFTLTLDTLIQRIVFKTKPGYPHGKDYWTHNYQVNQIDTNAFKRPLRAIGVEYSDKNDSSKKVFVPCTDVICSLGTLGTPVLLMQSGIGPKNLLISFGIPVLFNQPNMGKYVGNHYGANIRWNGNALVWGTNNVPGKENSNAYLPGPDSVIRRKFQYFSSIALVNLKTTWVISLFDLNPKSTGHVETKNSVFEGLLAVKIFPNYYSDPHEEDKFNLCWIARHIAAAVVAADPTATFVSPNLPYPFPDDNEVLFAALLRPTATFPPLAGFTEQAHYVGSCGMGPDPNIHCVNTRFLLRGTKNVRVCDASSTPIEVDSNGVAFPVQNDGNTSRGVNALSIVCAEQLLESFA